MTDVALDGPLASSPENTGDTRRFFHMRDVEWRDSANGLEEYTFTGCSTVFGSWSELLWTPKGIFRERFIAGAYEDVLARDPDVRLLQNHNKDLILARTKSGTLEIQETEESLRTWARIAKTSYATDLRLAMKRGDVDQMSVQFEMDYENGAEDRWYIDPKTDEVRHDVIKVSDLYDESIVTFPAYAETAAVMRDLTRAQDSGRFESYTVNTINPRYKATNAATADMGAFRRTYERCRQAMAETVWAMHPSYINLFFAILDERAAGHKPSAEEIQERIGVTRDNEPEQVGSVAVIPLMGPIMPRAGAMAQTSGVKSLADFRAEFRQAVNSPDVKAIVLDIDSPGGVVDGVPEMADEIRAARGSKPIVSVANYMAASAAYWIATAADELVVSPSAEVGSVGVYAAHQDRSAEMEMKGIKTTYVHFGDNKVEYHPEQPLSDDAKEYLQGQVDEIGNDFVATVAKNRRVSKQHVLDNFGQGRMSKAKDAVEVGMADRIATLDDVVSEMQSKVETRDFAEHIAKVYDVPTGTLGPTGPPGTPTLDQRDADYYAELYRTTTLSKSSAAIPPHKTSVIDKPWDAGANVKRVKSQKGPLRALHAWVDSSSDPNAKGSYKFPHHEVDSGGTPGPANVNGVRNALARLTDAKIPEADKPGVKRHLQRHLDDFHASSGQQADVVPDTEEHADMSDHVEQLLREAGWPEDSISVLDGTVVIDEEHHMSEDVLTRGFLGLVATAETDPSGNRVVASAERDPAGDAEARSVAQAETDPAGEAESTSLIKAKISARAQKAREEGIRLNKESSRGKR